MQIKAFSHLAFNCRNIDRSVAFYRDVLGCTEKFSLTYSAIYDSIASHFAEKNRKIPAMMNIFKKRSAQKWLVYMEFSNGNFIELFNSFWAFIPHRAGNFHYHYQHFALVVDDIQKTRQDLVANGVSIDQDIQLGPDYTYQMWIHDPDGNKFELMQYTERSMQVIGQESGAETDQ